jgi:amino-acid N-acetyltransferase
MEIRQAKIQDVEAIYSLINYYAELDRMLFRPKADIYENLQSFMVAQEQGQVIGCCCLQIIWKDLAEIKSLAVHQDYKGKGIGRELVFKAVEKAKLLGVPKVMALTLEKDFFGKIGFKLVDKEQLPMKVWSDCAKCSKQANCDEIAFLIELN